MLFQLGRTVATPAALQTMENNGVRPQYLLLRHVQGDWGKVSEHDAAVNDAAVNDAAVKDGSRILSVYEVFGQDVWVITEADRSVSTILLPSEY